MSKNNWKLSREREDPQPGSVDSPATLLRRGAWRGSKSEMMQHGYKFGCTPVDARVAHVELSVLKDWVEFRKPRSVARLGTDVQRTRDTSSLAGSD